MVRRVFSPLVVQREARHDQRVQVAASLHTLLGYFRDAILDVAIIFLNHGSRPCLPALVTFYNSH